MPKLLLLPMNRQLEVPVHTNLLRALRENGVFLDAPCGGQGKCGKCRVLIEGTEVLACQTEVCENLQVTILTGPQMQILQAGVETQTRFDPLREGPLLAFDLGTTSVVCYLLDGITGKELTCASMRNPQTAYGADVVSRIRSALNGAMPELTRLIRDGMICLTEEACQKAGSKPEEIGVVSVVGNPCMQQLFLGIIPENLSRIPFSPAITRAEHLNCENILPCCPHAQLLVVPDLSGYVGADTLACILASGMELSSQMTLMVDIGTNGELVLGNRDQMLACATAAGPALEGADIQFGMRAATGAIDHVWWEAGKFHCSVIGDIPARGICGSGLVDAVAVALERGMLNSRGKILSSQPWISLSNGISLSQEDIRQIQMAKGAICSGILLMTEQMEITPEQIDRVFLSGAFGNFLNTVSACRIGMLPEGLEDRIVPIGNAAGTGARMLACDRFLLPHTEALLEKIRFLELASLKQFPRTFSTAMRFRENT